MGTNTEFTVTAKQRGIRELNRDIEKTAKSLSSGGRAANRVMQDLEGQLKKVTARQIELGKEMKGVKEGTEQYKLLADSLKRVESEAKRTESALRRIKQTTKEDAGKGGMLQGFLQGAAPGTATFLQRGPGMRRQIMGMAAGRMAAGIPGAFTGLGGFQQGLAGLPIVGGMLAGQFGTQMQMAQRALGYQTQRLDMAPFLSGGDLGSISRAGSAAGRRMGRGATTAEIDAKLAAQRAAGGAGWRREDFYRERKIPGTLAAPTRWVEDPLSEEELKSELDAKQARMRQEMKVTSDIKNTDRKRAIQSARARARRELFNPIEQAGLSLAGMGREQALQFMSPILQAGGGSIKDLESQGMTRAAFAAQRGFGIGSDVSGAFLKGGRRGGIVGGRGRGGDALAEAIGDAITMKLENSEINTYLQQTATGIRAFEQTGIPVNSKSLSALGGVLATTTSLAGPRGVNIAAGLQRAVQGMPGRGINNQIDLMMLQTVGGFQGGGADALLESFKRMESGKSDPKNMGRFISQISSARGGGASGILGVRSALSKQLGVQVSAQEAEELTRLAESGSFAAIGERLKEITPMDAGGLEERAKEMMKQFGGATKRNAAIQNKQLASGEKLLGVMQDLEESSSQVNTAFSNIFKELKPVTENIKEFTSKFPEFVEAVKEFPEAVNKLVDWVP